MTSHLVNINAWDGAHGKLMSARQPSRPYVLVADGDRSRAELCVESTRALNVEAIVARDGQEALAVLQRQGPPVLLIVDLSLPHGDGFAVIEALVEADRRVATIAWSSRREVREFAAQRLAAWPIRILGGTVAPAVLRAAIAAALPRHGAQKTFLDSAPPAADDVHETMVDLSVQAQRLCGTAGVAVYLKGPGDTQFRTSVTWASDVPLPPSPDFLPAVFDAILATGEPLFRPDLTIAPSPDVAGAVRGLAAVPIFNVHRQIIGAICVFDLTPLTIGSDVVEALKMLGRGVLFRPAAGEAPVDVSPSQIVAAPTPAPSQSRSLAEPAAVIVDRAAGQHAVARELSRMRREQHHLSVVLFNVGASERADEGAGSPGDALGIITETLAKAIRGSDLAIRWTNDGLLVVFPGLGAAEARPVAERVRAAMQAGARYRLAVAGGVAELLPDETFDSVVARAGEKLRLARERGDNRVG